MSYDRKVEPTQITQGEKIAWTRTFCDYPASLYTLSYRFRGDGTGFDVDATADGDDFDAVVTAANSAAAAVGKYRWQAWLTEIADTTNKNMILEGTVEMLVGFAAGVTTAVDLRSNAKIMLDTLDAALLAAGSSDMVEYEVRTPAGGHRVKREARSEVIALRKYWAGIVTNEIAREDARKGKPLMKTIQMRVYDK